MRHDIFYTFLPNRLLDDLNETSGPFPDILEVFSEGGQKLKLSRALV